MPETVVHPCHTPGLALWDQVDCYCERALNPAFWAEPLNAVSNLAFMLAAVMAYADYRATSPKRGDPVIIFLIIWMMVIGAGSFLFHTFATSWARIADVVPIGVFVFAFVLMAYRWLIGLNWLLALAVAIAVTVATFAMPPWFNGSALYGPALLMLVVTCLWLWLRGNGAAKWLLSATIVFAVSLTLRTIDRTDLVCGVHQIGTHWAWHTLNAVVLYLLLRALIDDSSAVSRSAK
jgi:hypothetical protein